MRLAFFVLLAFAVLPAAARAQTIVSLTFDDGIKTQMLVRQSMLSHGMHGTFHINSGTIGTNSYYMTWADVDALNADGNEIAGHTVDHKRLTDLTATAQRSEICDDAANLRSRGYTVNTFAYPYGAGSTQPAVRQALLDCGFLSARKFGDLYSQGCTDSSCPFSESIPPANAYGIRTPEWQPDEYTVTDLESWVTQAETSGGGWVPIVFHDMCNQCADSSVSVATFNAFLDWLQPRAANGTIVKRVRDVVAPTAPAADVQITKTDSPDPVAVGSNLTYTLKVHNNGPDPAAAVTVSDPLPAGMTFVSASATKGTCSGTSPVSCNIGTIDAGTANEVTVTIVATAGQSAVPSVTNTATVTTSTPESNTANNTASAPTTVSPSADLQLSKTDSPDPVTVGNNLTYTMTVHNAGPSPAAAVTLSDPLPSGLTFVSSSSTKGTCSGTTTVSCNIGTVNAGTANNVTVTIVATAGQGAVPSVTNTATASSTTGDPSSSNNTASAPTTVNPSADLQLSKTDSPDPVSVGGNLTYTVVVHNNGPSPAAGVTLSDPLPADLIFVSASSTTGTCTGTTTVSCNIGTVNAGTANNVTVTIVATAGQGAVPSVTNTATVSSTTGDPSSSNNTASAPTTVNPSADLQLSKTDSPDPVSVGGNLTYTLTVHNAGPSAAAGVVVSDLLPSGLTFVSASSTKGTCTGTTTASCDIGTVTAGAANDVTVTIVATASQAAVPSIANTATVTTSTSDPSASNNRASAPTTVTPSADLQLSKSDAPDPVVVGGDVTYTLTVHNAGPSPAAGVAVSDPLPDGVTLVSASSTQGTCAGTTTVSCDLGALAAGAANDVTVTIVATADQTATPGVTNTATVLAATADPSAANNQASAQTTVKAPPAADLQLSKTGSPDPAQAGGNIIYTLTVHNAGPDPASSVTVSDPLPAGLVLVAATSTQGTCSGTATVTCTLGTANAGTPYDATVTIIATADQAASPSVTNTATVSSSTADPSSANNQASAQTTVNPPPAADLQISKTDSPDPVGVGSHLTYTLSVHNAGPDTAAGVAVSDPLPSGETLVSATPTQGSCSGTTTVSCDLGSIASGAANDATVTIVVTPDHAAVPSVTNTAMVASSTADPSPSNNHASTDTAVIPSADLQLAKNDSPDPVVVGGSVTYTLALHNAGPSPAADVSVSDPLPDGLTLVSAASTQGSCSGTTTVSCYIGTVNPGPVNDVTVSIVATAGESALPGVTNTATATSSTADPNSSNNQASAHTTVNPAADLQLSKTGSPDTVTVGENVTYGLTVHNAGPSPAAGVAVSDPLPDGVTLVSASSTQGTCAGTTMVSCDLDALAAGAANDVTVTIVATAGPAAAPSVTNTGTVSSSTGDPIPANNQASAHTTVNPSADLQLSKTGSPDSIGAGGNVTYTLTVHNAGPSPAAAATVSDPLPAGVTLVSASPTKGTCSGTATVSCDLGTVSAGTANDVTVTIVATTDQGAIPSVTNAATVSTATPDPTSGNNQASAHTTVNPGADVQLAKTGFPNSVTLGDNVTYTLTVHNAGPSPAADVSVSDPLPDGLTLVSAASTQGSCSGTTTVSCDIGTLNAGSANDVTVSIVATTGQAALPSVTNGATVSTSTLDPNSSNNQASAHTTVSRPPSADLQLVKSDSPDPVNFGENVTYVVTVHDAGPDPASGVSVSDPLPSGLTLVSASSTQGICSGTTTISCDLGTVNAGAANDVTVTIIAGVGQGAGSSIRNTATVSSSTPDPSASNNEASADTAVSTASTTGYARPKGASPLRVSLVPASDKCVSPNSTHGPPLNLDSCRPPRQVSHQLTIGSPDANGAPVNSSGSVVMQVLAGNPATPQDEADVNLSVSMTDVRKASDLSDYSGELAARAMIRLTDRRNGPDGTDPATVSDFDLEFPVPCTPTSQSSVGATCSVHTTADAVTPGMVMERSRSVWEVGQIVLDDGGPDGIAATRDNQPFAVQGVYVP